MTVVRGNRRGDAMTTQDEREKRQISTYYSITTIAVAAWLMGLFVGVMI